MNSMEQKNRINERMSGLENRLSRCFEQLLVLGKSCFRKDNGVVFSLSKFPGEDAIVIEYAESYEDALLHRFEDGDRFYLEDMSEESMFDAMIREIEQ